MNTPKPATTIPTFSLARQVKNLRPQFTAALEKVIDSQSFIGGKFIETIEKQLADYLHVKHVISCNSGTDALMMALRVLDMPKDAIVLTTPFSFIASSSEIAALGAHPVFIDIEQDTYNIDPNILEAWLQSSAVMKNGTTFHRTTGFPIVGMLPVDIFGQCADYDALNRIAKKWNLWIVEDCAQSLGAQLNGKMAGTLGTIGITSFYPTKNLGAFGDGGCCMTDDDGLAEKLLTLRNHGRKQNYEYESLGINSRLDAFQAVILSEKLPLLDTWNEQRRTIAQWYYTGLSSVKHIHVPRLKIGTHVYHQYSLIVEHVGDQLMRAKLEEHLTQRGVQTRIFYPQTLPELSFLRTHPQLLTTCPVADFTVRNILSLPMWPELERNEVAYVIECVREFFELHASVYNQEKSCNAAAL
ncbi:MAG: DegT/DnrJ/EryC1/StrS family aminotransferase [Candidatus Babeliales bacterium]|jgi:dTDP-4-amino-4,6-dideoxygalactose transaminase